MFINLQITLLIRSTLDATPFLHRVLHSAVTVPAGLFQYLEGGCEGV